MNEQRKGRRPRVSALLTIVALTIVWLGGCGEGSDTQVHTHGTADGAGAAAALSHQHGAEPRAETKTLYTCSMHPQVIQDTPGTCPICRMKLEPIEVAAGENPAAPPRESGTKGMVVIDPAVVQNMGVRTARVVRRVPVRTVRAVGYLDEAEPRSIEINLRVSGWIESLAAATEGQPVTKGEALFTLYSPELQVAIEELIAAKRAVRSAGGNQATFGASMEALLASARTKLLQWGLSEAQVAELSRLTKPPRAVPILSPISGHLMEKDVIEGASVAAGARVMRLVDHSVLWLDVRVYERDLAFIRKGQAVTARIDAVPGEDISGRIEFIHPHVDPATRTVLVRIEVENDAGRLRPGMYATARIEAPGSDEALLVPHEAVIDTGEREVVFIAKGSGRFEPREVHTGSASDGGLVEIRHGLSGDEEVVTSGQFLLDAESRIRETVMQHLHAH